MTGPIPKFFTSKYFVPEIDNWHLKKGAPKEIQKEFDAWMKKRRKDERGDKFNEMIKK